MTQTLYLLNVKVNLEKGQMLTHAKSFCMIRFLITLLGACKMLRTDHLLIVLERLLSLFLKESPSFIWADKMSIIDAQRVLIRLFIHLISFYIENIAICTGLVRYFWKFHKNY